MNDKMKTLQVKKYDHDYKVVLTYDKCKSGENQYGPWNLYGVEYEGVERGLFAEEALHHKLKKYGKGTKLVIRKGKYENDKLKWQVIEANGNNRPSKQTVSGHQDDRTTDIHRQVALKIATASIGQSTRPWANEDILEIQERMDKLLIILDGKKDDDLSN